MIWLPRTTDNSTYYAQSLEIRGIESRLYFKNQLSTIIGGTKIITNKRKNTCFYKIIHFSMQFSDALNIFIAKTLLNPIFTNDLKRKYFFFEKDLASLNLITIF